MIPGEIPGFCYACNTISQLQQLDLIVPVLLVVLQRVGEQGRNLTHIQQGGRRSSLNFPGDAA